MSTLFNRTIFYPMGTSFRSEDVSPSVSEDAPTRRIRRCRSGRVYLSKRGEKRREEKRRKEKRMNEEKEVTQTPNCTCAGMRLKKIGCCTPLTNQRMVRWSGLVLVRLSSILHLSCSFTGEFEPTSAEVEL